MSSLGGRAVSSTEWMEALHTDRLPGMTIPKLAVFLPSDLAVLATHVVEIAIRTFRIEVLNIRLHLCADNFRLMDEYEEVGAKVAVVGFDERTRAFWFVVGEEWYRCLNEMKAVDLGWRPKTILPPLAPKSKFNLCYCGMCDQCLLL
jgi:hypothetical protein